jgi:hypothetical protein
VQPPKRGIGRARRGPVAPRTPTSPLQSGTVAAAAAIASVTPHGTGAIDVVLVRHAGGRVASTPFYVRFGKYTGARSADRRVRIEVNGGGGGGWGRVGETLAAATAFTHALPLPTPPSQARTSAST